MTAFNNLNHIAGPAILTYDTQVWYTEGDINVDIVQAEWIPKSSRYGGLGPRISSLPVGKISFTPDGQITSGRAAKAFPYGLGDVGKSIFGGGDDKPLVIQTLAGMVYTFGRAGVSGTPGLTLAPDKTVFTGTMQFTCIGKKGVDPTTANAFLQIAAGAFADVSFDETKILTSQYTAAYGATTGLTAMDSLDGFHIECPISVQELSVNRMGVVDSYLTGIGPATCKFTPAGMTEAVWLTLVNLDGSNVRLPGTESGAGSTDLVITGTGLTVTLPKCGCVANKLNYGTAKERLGEVMFHNRPVFTVGVPGSLLTIAVA